MTQDNNSLEAKISAMGLRIGNDVNVADPSGGKAAASNPIYVDANQKLASGSLPFTLPLAAGTVDTSFSMMSLRGSATGTANDLMHLNLVLGANATATIAGYARITVTDDAGVITTGAYYMPFYTLG